MRRLRILWRSGRTSNVDGGGRLGVVVGGGGAGVTEPVGGNEVVAEMLAWGVAAADMMGRGNRIDAYSRLLMDCTARLLSSDALRQ
jgi:hypothetical protein